MPSCRRVKDNLTAWIDGEAGSSWNDRIQAHLARCPSCQAEAQSLREAVGHQRDMLGQLLGPAPSDAVRMLATIRNQAARRDQASWLEEEEGWWTRWAWLARPVPVALAVAALLVVTLVEVAGGPEDVLVPIGAKAPPAAVKRKPAMFRDYAIIEKLEALENFDTVEVEPLDDVPTEEQG